MTFDSFRRARRNRLDEFVAARLRCVEKAGFFTRLQSAFTLLSRRFELQIRSRVFLNRKTPLAPGYLKEIAKMDFENGRWPARRIWTCHLLPRLRIVAMDFPAVTRL
jgi:hypothetical protein